MERDVEMVLSWWAGLATTLRISVKCDIGVLLDKAGKAHLGSINPSAPLGHATQTVMILVPHVVDMNTTHTSCD